MGDKYDKESKDQANSEKKNFSYFNYIKLSVFCGIKGSVTFVLALVNYINYFPYCFLLKQKNNEQANTSAKKYHYLQESAIFSIVRNIIPFFEVIIITPLVCFGIPKIPSVDNLLKDHVYLYYTLICIVLMIAICFIVRVFELREKLTKRLFGDHYNMEKIKNSFKQDDIHYPIYKGGNLMFNFPDQNNYENQKNIPSRRDFILLVLLNIITLPLKLIQAITMLSLTVVELCEAVFNLPFDLCYSGKDKFIATKSGLKRSGYLLYGFIRNIIDIIFFPIMVFINTYYQVYKNMSSPLKCLDDAVAKYIGEVKSTCCSI